MASPSFWMFFYVISIHISVSSQTTGKIFNACCSYPCQNNGVCTPKPKTSKGYECDCSGLDYYGKNCEKETWIRWLKNKVMPCEQQKQDVFYNYPYLWSAINSVGFLYRKALLYVYFTRESRVLTPHLFNAEHDYTTLDVFYNRSFYARDLPPIPCKCATPMGVAGPKVLPCADVLYEKIFKRKKFKPDPRGTNLIFSMFAEHFVHQFFKSSRDKGEDLTRGDEGVDASQIYGSDAKTRWALRSRLSGKMKTRLFSGEEYPPYLEDAPEVEMVYPAPEKEGLERILYPLFASSETEVSPKWALGHPWFSRSPSLFVMATIWIREHNRVCEILEEEHPDWDDEKLYQTARLVILGEMLTITMSQYIQHLSQYQLQLGYYPEVTHGYPFQYTYRIRQEFLYLCLWHQLEPEEVVIGEKTFNSSEWMFGNNAIVFENGFDKVVEAFNKQLAGKVTHRNNAQSTEKVTKHVINESRKLRVQSFNNYRRLIGLEPYKTFEELTRDRVLAQELRDLYQDIDAVELYTGFTVEYHTKAVLPPTMIALGGPWAVKGVMANPIGSPGWWKPSTFGGYTGFTIVKEASIQNLFCNNLKSQCKGFKIDFKVPDDVLEKAFPKVNVPVPCLREY